MEEQFSRDEYDKWHEQRRKLVGAFKTKARRKRAKAAANAV
jgi:hypothetical protein